MNIEFIALNGKNFYFEHAPRLEQITTIKMFEGKKPSPHHHAANPQNEGQEQLKIPFVLNRAGQNKGRIQQLNKQAAQGILSPRIENTTVQEPESQQDVETTTQEELAVNEFMFRDVKRTMRREGQDLYLSPFTKEDAIPFNDASIDANGYPTVFHKGRNRGFSLTLLDMMDPEPGDEFYGHYMNAAGMEVLSMVYNYNPKPPETKTENANEAEEEKVEETPTETKVETPSEPYWTHAWHVDRHGREALWIWEVGGKRWYSNADKGFVYIRKMAFLEPGDPGYDPRFLKYRHRPQVGDYVGEEYNWWFKKSPGWDNKDHKDDGTADFNDLSEFKDTDYNKKGTGFRYMGYKFDPKIYEKLEALKKKNEPDPNEKYIGVETDYRGYVSAENGIILHTTPDPEDKDYRAKQKLDDAEKKKFIISTNQPLTVIAQGGDEYEGWILVEDGSGNKGWIEQRFTSKKANIQADDGFDRYTVKPGDTLEDLIKSYYKNYPYATGNDRRTVALAIYLYNKDRAGSGVYRNYRKYRNAGSWKDYVDPWMQETRANYQSVELYAGGEVILPPKEYIEKMRQSGQIEKRPDFVNFMIETGRVVQGFIDGVGEGFIDAIVSTAEDLYNMIVDIFTGEIFSQIADLFEMLWEKGLSGVWDMIKDFGTSTWKELKAAWNNPNPYQRGKYFGEIIGAVLFEVVLAILTAGIGTSIKLSVKVQKVLKWFPDLNTKKVVPNNVDHYADDIKKMNKDKDLDRKKQQKDKETDKDKDNPGADAKAVLAAKAYVEAQDALDPSPPAKTVASTLNVMKTTKLSGGKKYDAKLNGLGADHFKIYYNPTIKGDYTQGSGKSKEVVEKFSTYEQARNRMLELVGNIEPSTPVIGRLSKSKGFGKVIGRQSPDGKIRWRVDYDPQKGTHINVEDFSLGKGDLAKKTVLLFDGNESAFESILKTLNK